MKQKKKLSKGMLGIILSFMMVLGLMPGTGLTTLADSANAYSAYDVTTATNREAISIRQGMTLDDYEQVKQNLRNLQVEFNSKPWYIIEDNSGSASSGTVTLLAADDSFGSSTFSDSSSNVYANSKVKGLLDGLTGENGSFYDVADVIIKNQDTDGKLYLLSVNEAQGLPERVLLMYDMVSDSYEPWNFNNKWWLSTPGSANDQERIVMHGSIKGDGEGGLVSQVIGIRPALKLDLSKVSFDDSTKTFKMVPVTPYPIWVGGTQVTSANAANITAASTPTASYDVTSNTLTLNGVSINTGHEYNDNWHYSAGIYYENSDTPNKPLNIILEGTNSIRGTGITDGIYGGNNYGSFTFSGDGSLNATGTSSGIGTYSGSVTINSGTIKARGTENKSSGIYSAYSITINGGNVEATGTRYGIEAKGVSITGGTVTAKATNSTNDTGYAIHDGTDYDFSITGGTVTATGASSSGEAYGLYKGGSGTIKIGADITSLTVSGTTSASHGTVENSVAGMGWTTVDGTGDGTEIAVNTSGASLDTYKKLFFPYEKPAATVTTAPTAKSDLIYTGTAQELVTKGIALGGTMNYALGKDASTVPTEGWAAEIPTGTDAKKYYIWYKAVGDNTHSDSKAECVTAEIAEKLEAKVTFKVVNGSWDEGGTEDQTVTLTGKAGDTLKLSKDQIPAVGTKPNDGYKEGGWDVTPGTDIAITADTTYTYKYVEKEASPSVKFELDKIELAEDGTEKLSVTVVPEGTKVSYTSSDEKVATVDENGNVTAKGEGTAIITAKITVGGVEYTGTCTVTVARKIETKIEEEALTDDNISPALKELGYDTKEKVENKLGEALNLDTAEKKENTSLSDVKLMVRIDDGEWHEATAENFPAGGLAVKLPFPVTADGTQTNGEDYTFEVAHLVGTTIGDVEAGTVEKPEVTVTSDGLSTTFMGLSPVMISWEKKSPEPTPTPAPTPAPEPTPTYASITLNISETYLTQGMEKALKATTKPEGSTVSWSSSDNSIAYVDGRGVVIGLKPGTATITATITVDGKEYSASCKVTVVPTGFIPSGKSDGGHSHKFVWVTIEATEDSDGELRYQCETCGEIQTRVPLTAYNVFNKNTTEKIRKAPKDSTVKIETNKWISFHKMVMEALAERKDVTLEISFLDGEYKGNRCTVVIPKGTDTMSLVDKNGFTGFLFLGGKFGMKTN